MSRTEIEPVAHNRDHLKAKLDDIRNRVAEAERSLVDRRRRLLSDSTIVRSLLDELELLREGQHSQVAEVIRPLNGYLVLVKLVPDGTKMAVHVAEDLVGIDRIRPRMRVALTKDLFVLHKILSAEMAFDPAIQLLRVQKSPQVTYDQLGGLSNQILALREIVELPLLHPELFESLGIQQPKAVLLFGPPGTGKTTLARAVAHHCGCSFITVCGAELIQKYIGEGSRLVRQLFAMARRHSPAIIFMDQMDVIAVNRNSEGDGDEVQRTLLELVNQIDGFEPLDKVKLIFATNRADLVNHSLLRPGRIDRKVQLSYPSGSDRIEILRIHSGKMSLGPGINLRRIADAMPMKTTGADIKAICMEAGLFAIRERRKFVVEEDFMLAVAKIGRKDHKRSDFAQMPTFP